MSKATNKINKHTKAKPSVVKAPKITTDKSRFRKKPAYKSFKLHNPVERPDLKISSWLEITKKAFKLIRANAKPIAWFFVVYGLLYLIFVRGVISPVDIDSVKDEIEGVTGDGGSTIITNITVMSLLFESAINSGGDVAALYQMIFLISSTLALIWLFRQQQAGNKVSIKDAFYRGMYPVIPFTLIILVIALQTLPATIGNFLFSTVTSSGIAVTFVEQTVWVLLLLTTSLLSLYMISASIIALFIVTLPEMTPMLALRQAKELVTFRRVKVLSKVVVLFILVGLIYSALVLPAIFVSAALAQAMFFFLTVFIVPFAVAYLFVLYRELL